MFVTNSPFVEPFRGSKNLTPQHLVVEAVQAIGLPLGLPQESPLRLSSILSLEMCWEPPARPRP